MVHGSRKFIKDCIPCGLSPSTIEANRCWEEVNQPVLHTETGQGTREGGHSGDTDGQISLT